MIPHIIDGYTLQSEGGGDFTDGSSQKEGQTIIRLGYVSINGYEVSVDLADQSLLSAAALVGGIGPDTVQWREDRHQETRGELLAYIKDLEIEAATQETSQKTVREIALELALSDAVRSDAVDQFNEAEVRIGQLEAELESKSY